MCLIGWITVGITGREWLCLSVRLHGVSRSQPASTAEETHTGSQDEQGLNVGGERQVTAPKSPFCRKGFHTAVKMLKGAIWNRKDDGDRDFPPHLSLARSLFLSLSLTVSFAPTSQSLSVFLR